MKIKSPPVYTLNNKTGLYDESYCFIEGDTKSETILTGRKFKEVFRGPCSGPVPVPPFKDNEVVLYNYVADEPYYQILNLVTDSDSSNLCEPVKSFRFMVENKAFHSWRVKSFNIIPSKYQADRMIIDLYFYSKYLDTLSLRNELGSVKVKLLSPDGFVLQSFELANAIVDDYKISEFNYGSNQDVVMNVCLTGNIKACEESK